MNWQRILGLLLVVAAIAFGAFQFTQTKRAAAPASSGSKTNIVKGATQATTGAVAKVTAPAPTKGATNAPVASAPAKPDVQSQLMELLRNPYVFGPIGVGILLLVWSLFGKKKKTISDVSAAAALEKTSVVKRAPSKPTSFASCNILRPDGATRRLWHFETRGGQFVFDREHTVPGGEPLPAHLVAKSWSTLWSKKLNIAWLPPEKIFLRAVQLPKVDFSETLSMVEFQLEKISPLPVAQIVWSVHVLPQTQTAPRFGAPSVEPHTELPLTQTVIVTIVSRNIVEEFLGNLEQENFLADRLEVPMLDVLGTTPVRGEGAWVYPDSGNPNSALVAWWYSGVLQSLGLVQAAPGPQRAESLREQLTQMAWAGELDGWLSSPPQWHVVADATQAAEWQAALQQALDQSVEVISPQPIPELASATARRAADTDPRSNLLPPEHALRYRQQFIDRLWMHGLGAVVGVYVVAVLIYFVALQVLSYRTGGVERNVAGLGQQYTNAIQLKARYDILRERQELKYAPLECWRVTAELLPAEATLQSLDLVAGKRLTLRGVAPADKVIELNDFNSAMQKATDLSGKQLFAKVEPLGWQKDLGGNTASWNFSCELKQTEGQ